MVKEEVTFGREPKTDPEALRALRQSLRDIRREVFAPTPRVERVDEPDPDDSE